MPRWVFAIALLILSSTAQAAQSDAILDQLARGAFDWFTDNRNAETGQVLDRAPRANGQKSGMSSVAATGYYVSLLPEWVRLGWISKDDGRREARKTLEFALHRIEHHEGVLYHFVDWRTGQRWGNSEVSLLDSAIFFNGCMVAGEYFGPPVADRADALLDRVNWPAFFVNDPQSGKQLLSLGWSPEKNLLSPMDVRSSEFSMPYFLAVGSRTHPAPPQCWYDTRIIRGKVEGYEVLNPSHALFTSWIGLGWHDLKGRRDRDGVDFYASARLAALANRASCRGRLAKQFKTYRIAEGGWWGISAGDSPAGYVARGPGDGDPDGTVWPLGALGALPFAPAEFDQDLPRWRASAAWARSFSRYGLSPFSLDKNWVAPDLIGIDLGGFALALADHRNRTAWNLWMRHPIAAAAMKKLGYAK